MVEHSFITDIVNLIVNHWDIFKYVFIAISVKYIGEAIFSSSKGILVIVMIIRKVFFNKEE